MKSFITPGPLFRVNYHCIRTSTKQAKFATSLDIGPDLDPNCVTLR